MQQCLISVIIPVYNTEQYLKKCMDSILEQTYQNLEIILVDDGSTDQSPAICDFYSTKDARIKVIHKKNGGLISAWQAGVRATTGKYLTFVDSDDWIDAQMIHVLASQLEDGAKEQIICCNYVIEKEWLNKTIPVQNQIGAGIFEGKRLEKLKEVLLGYEQRNVSFSRCMKLFSKSLIKNNLYLCDERIIMGEDLNIVFPAMLDAQRIVCLQDCFFYHYRFVSSSMVHRYNSGLEANIHLLYTKICAALKEKRPNDDTMKKQAQKEYLYLLFLVIKNEVRGNRKYRHTVKAICKEPEIQKLLQQIQIYPKDIKNRLIYFVMQHPNRINVGILWLLFRLYDRK